MGFVLYKQLDAMDCGPSCLRMIIRHYGRNINLRTLSRLSNFSKDGVSLLGLSEAAEKLGFRTIGVKLEIDQLKQIELPCVLHWRNYHFVVLYKVKNNKFYIADPDSGLYALNQTDFAASWIADQEKQQGISLLLTPSPQFYDLEDENKDEMRWGFLFRYLIGYNKLLVQLFLGLAIGGLLQVIIPFLTQSIVDIGIDTRNLHFIYVILIAQMALIIGRVTVDFIRSWILLHVSTRVNISILTDFLIKMMKLPMSFFDTKRTGDIMQRMNDQKNIQSFLTGSALTTFFSLFNLLIFSAVLIYYNTFIFFVFAFSSFLYFIWISLFLKRRRELNYSSFSALAKNQSSVVQLIDGIQEIKLNNCERRKRWEWERIQAKIFNFNVKSLALNQYQQGGATFINESKNILITFLSAESVISGNLSLGAMIAIQYIIGQLNGPIEQILAFIQGYQDAKISLERLNEIHQMSDEEYNEKNWVYDLSEDKSISIKDLTFNYDGAGNYPVLKNLNLHIPYGKTTAIVGMSGSGKTTILKLLLRFYEPQRGEIKVGEYFLNDISYKTWRSKCGVVMQDGYLFSDTIQNNITIGDDFTDHIKLKHAIKVANIEDLIDALPLGLATIIGAEGNGISQGQKQRILIARAVYKNPEYIFFDEATNSLDANNESIIMRNLEQFFQDRTVIVVAHRLSTVNNADNIIVLDKGEIIEQGNHHELIVLRGSYYNLIRNQLELGV